MKKTFLIASLLAFLCNFAQAADSIDETVDKFAEAYQAHAYIPPKPTPQWCAAISVQYTVLLSFQFSSKDVHSATEEAIRLIKERTELFNNPNLSEYVAEAMGRAQSYYPPLHNGRPGTDARGQPFESNSTESHFNIWQCD